MSADTRHTEKLASVRPRPSERLTDADYIARFKSQSTTNDKGCWVHSGFQRASKGMASGAPGYIQISYRCDRWMIHRLSYVIHHGPIPDGKIVAHSCDNPPCWNPDHLSPKTESENTYEAVSKRRDRQTRKATCPRGHAYDYFWTKGNRRKCKTCDRIRQRVALGWTEHDAIHTPVQPLGYHPAALHHG